MLLCPAPGCHPVLPGAAARLRRKTLPRFPLRRAGAAELGRKEKTPCRNVPGIVSWTNTTPQTDPLPDKRHSVSVGLRLHSTCSGPGCQEENCSVRHFLRPDCRDRLFWGKTVGNVRKFKGKSGKFRAKDTGKRLLSGVGSAILNSPEGNVPCREAIQRGRTRRESGQNGGPG